MTHQENFKTTILQNMLQYDEQYKIAKESVEEYRKCVSAVLDSDTLYALFFCLLLEEEDRDKVKEFGETIYALGERHAFGGKFAKEATFVALSTFSDITEEEQERISVLVELWNLF